MSYIKLCSYVEEFKPEHIYTFIGPDIVTGEKYSVTVPAEGLYHYRQGADIQDAFPDLSPGDRMFLLTGLSPEGWALAFPEPSTAGLTSASAPGSEEDHHSSSLR